jgi:predicted membrane protein
MEVENSLASWLVLMLLVHSFLLHLSTRDLATICKIPGFKTFKKTIPHTLAHLKIGGVITILGLPGLRRYSSQKRQKRVVEAKGY